MEIKVTTEWKLENENAFNKYEIKPDIVTHSTSSLKNKVLQVQSRLKNKTTQISFHQSMSFSRRYIQSSQVKATSCFLAEGCKQWVKYEIIFIAFVHIF